VLHELIYTSVSVKGDIDVKPILDAAQSHNSSNNITGLLCFDGRRFLQILEGEDNVIEALYASIENDTRHKDVELLHLGKIAERNFSTWSMTYENLPFGMLDTLSENIGVMSMVQAKEQIAKIGESFGARIFGLFFHSTHDTEMAE